MRGVGLRRDAELLGLQVEHCPPTMPRRAGGARQARDQLRAHGRVGMRRGVGQHLEGQRQQRIAGEDRRPLVEGLVHGGRPRRRSSLSMAGRSSCTSE